MRHRTTYLYVLLMLIGLTGCSSDLELPRLNNDAVILSFGDSLTSGTGANKAESYPAYLEQLIARKVINAGVPGELSEQGLKRLPALLEEHQPDLLILCHGGNDLLRKKDLAQMGANVRAMIQLALDRNIPVVMLGVPPPSIFLSSAKIYREIAESTGTLLIEDIIADVLGDNSLKSDPAHPNSQGYRQIAEKIYTVLKDAGAV
jgi:acyl-CoA thioesterase I